MFPSTVVSFWSSLNVPVLPDDERVFLESIVDIGCENIPETRTLRNTHIVAVGGYGYIGQRATVV